jgi:hypothetical protein
MSTVTDPRVISDVALGVSWQAAEEEAVPGNYVPDQYIFARRIAPNEDANLLTPDGTHGQQFRHAGGRRVNSRAPKLELEIFGTKRNLCFLLEGALHGQPQSTEAGGDITETGDDNTQLSAWVLNGVRPHHNLEFNAGPPVAHKLYVDLVDATGTRTVTIWKDSGKTQKVAEGSLAGDGTITLAEQNNSGISGTVAVTYTTDDTDIVLTIDKIHYQFSRAVTRYFRMGYRYKNRTYIFSDCTIQQLEFQAAENAEMMIMANIVARRCDIQDPGSSSFIPADIDLETYTLSECVFTKDPSGTPVAPAFDDMTLTLENNINQYVGNSDLPQKLIKQGWQLLTGRIRGEMCDEFEDLIDQARGLITTGGAAAMTSLRVAFTYNGTFLIDMPVGHFRIPQAPEVSEELVEKVELEFDAVTDGSADIAAISLEV